MHWYGFGIIEFCIAAFGLFQIVVQEFSEKTPQNAQMILAWKVLIPLIVNSYCGHGHLSLQLLKTVALLWCNREWNGERRLQ